MNSGVCPGVRRAPTTGKLSLVRTTPYPPPPAGLGGQCSAHHLTLLTKRRGQNKGEPDHGRDRTSAVGFTGSPSLSTETEVWVGIQGRGGTRRTPPQCCGRWSPHHTHSSSPLWPQGAGRGTCRGLDPRGAGVERPGLGRGLHLPPWPRSGQPCLPTSAGSLQAPES